MRAALGVQGSTFMENTSLQPWALNVAWPWVGALTYGVFSHTSDWVFRPSASIYVGLQWMSREC